MYAQTVTNRSQNKQICLFVCSPICDILGVGLRTLVRNEVKIVKYILGHEGSLEGGNCPPCPFIVTLSTARYIAMVR